MIRRRPLAARLSLAVPLVAALLLSESAAAREEDARRRLDSVRSEISQVESNLYDARIESESLYASLQRLESDSLRTETRLRRLDADLKINAAKLRELDKQRQTAAAKLATERDKLSRQLRAAYISGRHNTLKLLLNQENPTQISRLAAYHGYFNRARARQIESIDGTLSYIAELRREITLESRARRELQRRQQAKLGELAGLKQQRREVLDNLQVYIADQDSYLQTLRKTEAELVRLLERLADDAADGGFESAAPFSSLRGKLRWPVRGDIAVAFGDAKKGGQMHATGVTFDTGAAAEVKAVADGRVVFADWFRNLGLLLIIDHGDDYMSLYGHNARILKKKGDWVAGGELISRAGETGGRRESGLYFEIRKNAAPVNPVLWCKR